MAAKVPVHQKIVLGIICLLFFLILIAHAAYYLPFISDDSLISLRYAQRLALGKGLTWNDGQAVEGYSNLLWVILLSFFKLADVDLIHAVRILGLGCMGIVIISLGLSNKLQKPSINKWMALFVGLLFMCGAGPIAIWSIGGLEQPLYAGLLSIAICLILKTMMYKEANDRHWLYISVFLGLICLTRPDGPLVTVAFSLTVLIFSVSNRKNVIKPVCLICLFPAIMYGGQIIFRIFYYGEFFPNTAYVKITPSLYHVKTGLKYIISGLENLAPFSFIAMIWLVFGLFIDRYRFRNLLFISILYLWIPYLIFIGGDIFPGFRHFIPIIIVLSFVLIDFGRWLFEKLGRHKPYYLYPTYLLVFILFIPFMFNQFTNHENQKASREKWEWDGQVIGILLNKAFKNKKPLVAVTAAGCIPYWSELPSLDLLGLNDYHLARHKAKTAGTDLLGHGVADAEYVLGQKPDIICFHVGRYKSMFPSGIEIQESPEFEKMYRPIKILGTYPHIHKATLWFLKKSEKTGVHYSSGNLIVPGYFLNIESNNIAMLDQNHLVKKIPAKQSARFELKGIWQADPIVISDLASPHIIRSTTVYIGKSTRITLYNLGSSAVTIQKIILKPDNAFEI